MKKLFPWGLALAALFALPLQAEADEKVSFKLGYQMLAPDGYFIGKDGGSGTKIDLEDDLSLDDSKELYAELAVNLGDFRLSAAYQPLSFSGTNTLSQAIEFNGTVYNVDDTVRGDIDLDMYDVACSWHLINLDDLPVRLQLGPEIAVKVFSGDLSVQSKATGVKETISGTAPVPTIGARARVGLADFLAVVGRIGFAEYSGNSFLDADAQLEFSPLPMVGLFAGYRYLDLDIDENDIVIDATFTGPYAGAFVRF